MIDNSLKLTESNKLKDLSEITKAYIAELNAKESQLNATLKAETKLWKPCLEPIKQKVLPQLVIFLLFSGSLMIISLLTCGRSLSLFKKAKNVTSNYKIKYCLLYLIHCLTFFLSLFYFFDIIIAIYFVSNLNVHQLLLKRLIE